MAGEGKDRLIAQGRDASNNFRDILVDADGTVHTVSAGGGSAVTIADGADVAEGAQADVAWVSGPGSLIAISKAEFAKLEAIRALLAASIAVTGTFWPTTAAAPASHRLSDGAAFYDAAKTGQLPAALVGGRLSVDASGVAVPVTDNAGSLTVDAPVGTPVFARLSDGAAALIGQKAMAASLPVVVASDQSAVTTKETPATIVGTTISAANTAVTLTLAAAGAGLFHYITSIEIVVINPTVTAIAAAATNLAWTSTNLGGLAWNAGTLLAAGAEKVIARMAFGPPLKSAVANTASTIVAPACGAGTLCRIQVTYYTAI